jgi:hypothetical protein
MAQLAEKTPIDTAKARVGASAPAKKSKGEAIELRQPKAVVLIKFSSCLFMQPLVALQRETQLNNNECNANHSQKCERNTRGDHERNKSCRRSKRLYLAVHAGGPGKFT